MMCSVHFLFSMLKQPYFNIWSKYCRKEAPEWHIVIKWTIPCDVNDWSLKKQTERPQSLPFPLFYNTGTTCSTRSLFDCSLVSGQQDACAFSSSGAGRGEWAPSLETFLMLSVLFLYIYILSFPELSQLNRLHFHINLSLRGHFSTRFFLALGYVKSNVMSYCTVAFCYYILNGCV